MHISMRKLAKELYLLFLFAPLQLILIPFVPCSVVSALKNDLPPPSLLYFAVLIYYCSRGISSHSGGKFIFSLLPQLIIITALLNDDLQRWQMAYHANDYTGGLDRYTVSALCIHSDCHDCSLSVRQIQDCLKTNTKSLIEDARNLFINQKFTARPEMRCFFLCLGRKCQVLGSSSWKLKYWHRSLTVLFAQTKMRWVCTKPMDGRIDERSRLTISFLSNRRKSGATCRRTPSKRINETNNSQITEITSRTPRGSLQMRRWWVFNSTSEPLQQWPRHCTVEAPVTHDRCEDLDVSDIRLSSIFPKPLNIFQSLFRCIFEHIPGRY